MWAEDVRERANKVVQELIDPRAAVVLETGCHAEVRLDQIVGIWLAPIDAPVPAGWVSIDAASGILVPAPGPEGENARQLLDGFNDMITSAQGWPIDLPGPPPAGVDAYVKAWERA